MRLVPVFAVGLPDQSVMSIILPCYALTCCHRPTAAPLAGHCASCCSTRAPAAWRTCSARPLRWRCPALATLGWCRSRRAAQTCLSQVGSLEQGGSDLPGVSATQQPLAGRPLPTSPFLHPPSRAAAEENRREFVELYVDFWLNGSIHSQFEAFAKGFLMLCGGPALQVRCPAMGRLLFGMVYQLCCIQAVLLPLRPFHCVCQLPHCAPVLVPIILPCSCLARRSWSGWCAATPSSTLIACRSTRGTRADTRQVSGAYGTGWPFWDTGAWMRV